MDSEVDLVGSKKHFFFCCKVAKAELMCKAQRQIAYTDRGSASAGKRAQDYIH